MRYIEPHAHMVSRTTDDYQALVMAGCQAVCEPAFWAGFDRSSSKGFYDYFRQLTDYEPKRAAKFDLPHYSWLCINPKEAEDPVFAREVMALIPEFLEKENVLGIGEIGLNKNSINEVQIFEEQVQLAIDHQQLILIHTPHLEDKFKGTQLILDILKAHPDVQPSRVLIDHVEEHTVRSVLDSGFWAGITLYPESKCTPQRAVDMLEQYGNTDRLWMNSACDWGISDPLSLPKAIIELRKRGFDPSSIDRFVYQNPVRFLQQCPKFKLSL
ncbi:MAG: TatD family hydrolase [Opitutaceae bacterium]